ncbi:MAG TPA: glycosyltransferase [Geminicoccaceae bacterium]|nr:glycosyltransferase [Geminicoccaceae bacterium]
MSVPRRLSVVIPVLRETPALAASFVCYRESLRRLGCPLEFVFVVDGPAERTLAALKALKRQGEALEILAFGHAMGEAAALAVGFKSVQGDVVMTLTAEPQVAPDELPRLVRALAEADMVVAAPGDGRTPAARSGKLDALVRFLFKSPFQDVRSGVRVLRRAVADELRLYGNQHRFLPLLAQAQGFKVREVAVRAAAPATAGRGMRVDPSLLLDVLTIYFLLRFINKPFRFFGGFGFAMLALGGLATLYLVAVRLLWGVPLADRPALILSTLLVVLGIQIVAVGLIGEIVTFAYAKELKDYRVERVVERPDLRPVAVAPAGRAVEDSDGPEAVPPDRSGR